MWVEARGGGLVNLAQAKMIRIEHNLDFFFVTATFIGDNDGVIIFKSANEEQCKGVLKAISTVVSPQMFITEEKSAEVKWGEK